MYICQKHRSNIKHKKDQVLSCAWVLRFANLYTWSITIIVLLLTIVKVSVDTEVSGCEGSECRHEVWVWGMM